MTQQNFCHIFDTHRELTRQRNDPASFSDIVALAQGKPVDHVDKWHAGIRAHEAKVTKQEILKGMHGNITSHGNNC